MLISFENSILHPLPWSAMLHNSFPHKSLNTNWHGEALLAGMWRAEVGLRELEEFRNAEQARQTIFCCLECQ